MSRITRAYGLKPLQNVFPEPIIGLRAPTTSDKNYDIGQLWVYKTTGQIYGLAHVSSGSATWSILGPGASDVDTLTGDSGGAISPSAGNITLSGTANEITTTGSGSTITWSIPSTFIAPGSVETTTTLTVGTDLTATGGDSSFGGGTFTVESGTNAINVSADAAATTVNVGTGAAAKTLTVGSSNTTSTTNIQAGSGGVNIDGVTLVNDSVNSNTSINTGTSTGTVTIGNGAAGAVTIDTGAGISLDAGAASNFTTSGAGIDIDIASGAGRVIITSGEDAADTIYLHADAGTGEKIRLHSDQGTGADSVELESDVGGITLTSGLASTDAVNLNATAGGVDIDGVLEVNITSSEAAVSDAVTISASAADGGITLDAGVTPGVTFTNGTQSHQMLVGTGSPNGSVTASQGSMYVDVGGSTSTTILFVNTDGSTTWVGVGA